MATDTEQPAFITCKQVTALTSLSKTSIYARITPNPKRPSDYDPTFPKPVRLGVNRVAWVLAEVQAWANSKIESSRNGGKAPKQAGGKKSDGSMLA